MTWNYRIIHRHYPETDAHSYDIHEVYYDEDDKPEMVTHRGIAPYGETYEEFVEDVAHYIAALAKPVLEYDEICTDGDLG